MTFEFGLAITWVSREFDANYRALSCGLSSCPQSLAWSVSVKMFRHAEHNWVTLFGCTKFQSILSGIVTDKRMLGSKAL